MLKAQAVVGAIVILAVAIGAFVLADSGRSTASSADGGHPAAGESADSPTPAPPPIVGTPTATGHRRSVAPPRIRMQPAQIAPERQLRGEGDGEYRIRLERLSQYRQFVEEANITSEQERVILNAFRDAYDNWRYASAESIEHGNTDVIRDYLDDTGTQLMATVEIVCTPEQVKIYRKYFRLPHGQQFIVRTDED